MKVSKYDRIIWRINGTIILLICLWALFGGAVLTFKLLQDLTKEKDVRDIVNVNPHTKKEEFFRLGHFNSLKNTDLTLIPLITSEEADLLISYKDQNHNVRNYLLFNEKTKDSSWVWENNDRLVMKAEKITQGKEENEKVIGIVFESTEKYSKNDNISKSNNMKNIDFFDFTDFSRVQLLKNISRVFDVKQMSNNEIMIFFLQDKKSYMATFNVSVKKVTSRKEIKLPK